MSRDPTEEDDDFVPARVPEDRPGQVGGKRHTNRLARTRALCEAALGVFLTVGLDAATIDDVVGAAGMSKGSFYRYFPNKEELVASLVRSLAADVQAGMDAAIDALEQARTDPELVEVYAALARHLLSLLPEHRTTVVLFLQERHGAATPARAPFLDLDETILRLAVRLTEAGQRTGLLRPVDPRVSATVVVGAVMELLYASFSGALPDEPWQSAVAVTEIVLFGVRQR